MDIKTYFAREQQTVISQGGTGTEEMLEKLKDKIPTEKFMLLNKQQTNIETILKNGVGMVKKDVLDDLREQLLPFYEQHFETKKGNHREAEPEKERGQYDV